MKKSSSNYEELCLEWNGVLLSSLSQRHSYFTLQEPKHIVKSDKYITYTKYDNVYSLIVTAG